MRTSIGFKTLQPRRTPHLFDVPMDEKSPYKCIVSPQRFRRLRVVDRVWARKHIPSNKSRQSCSDREERDGGSLFAWRTTNEGNPSSDSPNDHPGVYRDTGGAPMVHVLTSFSRPGQQTLYTERTYLSSAQKAQSLDTIISSKRLRTGLIFAQWCGCVEAVATKTPRRVELSNPVVVSALRDGEESCL